MDQHSYIRVQWLHSSSDQPADLWSELNANREEMRKVEIWADGRVGYASLDGEVGGTRLGEGSVPPLREIAADAQSDPKKSRSRSSRSAGGRTSANHPQRSFRAVSSGTGERNVRFGAG
jgi:hypothetical protein